MTNDFINIAKIETHLDSVIREHVCKQCYAGRLPSTLKNNVMKYVVIDCSVSIYDFNAYGKGIVNIFLYAQPTNGLKNVSALSDLESKFSKALSEDLFDSEHYSVSREVAYTDAGYDTSYGMDYIIKAIHLTII